MFSEEPNPRGLTDLDAEVLMDFVERQPTLRELAQKRGLPLLEFLDWWHSPRIAAALEAYLQFHAVRRELRHAQLREELIAILAQVAKTSTSAVEQRRAATTALTAMRSADARSRPRGSDLRGRRGPASHVAPSSPLGGGGRAPRPEGAPSSIASYQPPRSVTHSAHTVLPDLNGGFKGGAAPIDSNSTPPVSPSPSVADSPPAFATPLVALSRSIASGSAPPSASAPISVICGPSPSPSPDPEDDDPEGTLAIAHHVLEAVKSDPNAYPPEAVHAAHVYISLTPAPASGSAPIGVICGSSPSTPPPGVIRGSPPPPDTS